jgi:hypothetical protein
MNSAVRFTTKFNTEISTTTPGNAIKLLNLDGATATYGLSASSSIIAAYMDMYRFFRINRIKIRAIDNDTIEYDVDYPAVLAYLAPGNTADPTDWTDFETKHQVLTFGDPAHIGTLDISQKDLQSVGDWFITQNDASTEALYSAGEIWLANSANFSVWANPTHVAIFVEVDITFRTLLDPSLISSWKNQATTTTSDCSPGLSPKPKITSPPSALHEADADPNRRRPVKKPRPMLTSKVGVPSAP